MTEDHTRATLWSRWNTYVRVVTMPIRAGSRSSVRTHPDGTSSRSASELLAQLTLGRQNWGRWDEGERPEGMFDALLLELAVALRWEHR